MIKYDKYIYQGVGVMFQSNKNSYRIVAVCKNGDYEGRYSFIENHDEDWGTIAEGMFYDEFGVASTETYLESRETL